MNPKVYRGEALREISFPLGTGSARFCFIFFPMRPKFEAVLRIFPDAAGIRSSITKYICSQIRDKTADFGMIH